MLYLSKGATTALVRQEYHGGYFRHPRAASRLRRRRTIVSSEIGVMARSKYASALNLVFIELAVERRAVDAKYFSGFGLFTLSRL